MERELIAVIDGRDVPVLVRADPQATVDDLASALSEGGRLHVAGRALLSGTRLAALALPIGARLDPAGAVPGELDTADLEIAVAGGAGGAGRASLTCGLTVGRDEVADLSLRDREVSRVHVSVSLADDGTAELTDSGSRNGTAWRGVRLTEPAALAPGDVFGVGETVLTMRAVDPADAQTEPSPSGDVLLYNRPPRISFRPSVPHFDVPRRPEEPRGVRFPLVAILLPLVLAAVAYVLFPGAGYFLIFLALSPLLILANAVFDRSSGRKDHRKAYRDYEKARADLADRLGKLADEQGRARREAFPDPSRILRIATGPTRRLFERRPHDQDFLLLRLGLAEQPVEVTFTGQDDELPPGTIEHTPITVDLASAGVIGLAGRRLELLDAVRASLAHLATLHGPHDLGLVILTGQDEAAQWEWATWLPHTLPHSSEQTCLRMIATDARQAAARLSEVSRIVDERRTARQDALRAGPPTGRRLVVVADGARRLRGLAGMAELLATGPESGVYAICLDDDETRLPGECRATAVITSASGTRARIRGTDGTVTENVLLDRLDADDAMVLGHALAPLRVLGCRLEENAGIPDRIRLLDLVGLGDQPTPEAVAALWAGQPGGRSTAVKLGVGADGPVTIDLRRDGPHCLIAGTSGAGKSELLQTLVAGLALGNTPESLAMVLVDYKGGSAFAECADLPHCAGMVTDLDGHLATRALASLGAELRRREELLAEAAAKDIEDYWATGRRLPRLVIVVDEFATLAEEVPEFVPGLVGIGMRGRSLGVHVVLATQRPAGVVNAELRANLNLRICLRVTSSSDSADVIDDSSAARISRHLPGRAYLRAGYADLSLLQTARIGWPRGQVTGRPTQLSVRPRRVDDLGEVTEAQPVDDLEQDRETDLGVLVTAIRSAAEQDGHARARSPWLPPLPERVTADQLDATGLRVPIGLADHPLEQAQRPYLLDLENGGPILVSGMSRSGRSTLLCTFATEAARRNNPADVHLYVLDQGNQALAPLAGLPHCGAYVEGDDADRTARVLALLTEQIGIRQRLLAAGGHASLAEYRAAIPGTLPYLVLLVDRYETFLARYGEADGGRLVDVLDGLMRRGPSVGLVVMMATDRSGFTLRMGGAVARRLVLRHADPEDVSAYGVSPKQMPRDMPPGRLIAMPGAVEVQVALLDPDPDGAAQAAAVERVARESRWEPGNVPLRVDPLPESITTEEVEALRAGDRPAIPSLCTIGAGGDHLGPVDLDLGTQGGCFLIAGPPGSGRSGALMAVARSVTLPLLVVSPRPSPLRAVTGARVVTPHDAADVLMELASPCAVLVDDAEYVGDGAAADALEHLARGARDNGSLLIAAGTTEDLQVQRYRGWLAVLRRARTGLLLNPSSNTDGELFDLKLPSSTRGGWPCGRGVYVNRGQWSVVQVPWNG
ncbi:FtsK/SpoIIIE domain-containing protein [Streptosporangium sp. DT93]|uniref:FtsK/SpoIIIE domain-containing protein n=1 Tax=Streptosporangium sp. DT93 TaxID=3393428 RepID=UPI003CF64A9A